jgi:hypothetical protein
LAWPALVAAAAQAVRGDALWEARLAALPAPGHLHLVVVREPYLD